MNKVLILLALAFLQAKADDISWQKVNNYLDEKTNQSTDIDLNVRAAKEYLYMSENEKDDGLMQALIKVAALDYLTKDDVCDTNSFKAQKGVKDHISSTKEPHLFNVLNAVSTKHGNVCRSKYLSALEKQIASLDPHLLKDIDFALRGLIESKTRSSSSDSLILFKEIIEVPQESLIKVSDVKSVFTNCSSAVAGGSQREVLADCLILPCREFVTAVGSIYTMATMDNLKPSTDNSKESQFFSIWSRVKLCQTFIKRGARKLVEDINS